jgi:hypothetical protein
LTGVVVAVAEVEKAVVPWEVVLSPRAEILENPKTAKNPNSPIYECKGKGKRTNQMLATKMTKDTEHTAL